MSESSAVRPITERIRFILINPTHPGNIGATARAMKNMGWRKLYVVCDQPPDMDAARPMATSAVDVLGETRIVHTLDDALDGVVFAVGTTGRPRQWDFVQCTARELASHVLPKTEHGDVAIIFGTESSGLGNDVLNRCQAVCEIDTAGMKSLNLAQAVLIVSYELMIGARGLTPGATREVVDLGRVEALVQRWLIVWQAIGYMRDRNPEQFATTLRQILGRASMDDREFNTLMGFFNKARHYIQRTGGDIEPIGRGGRSLDEP